MKTPTEEEIIEEVEELKKFLANLYSNYDMHLEKRYVINKLNKILRMMKHPVRRGDIKFSQD